MHGAPDFKHRHRPTFKSHNPASMGKMLIPGDIIMQAFVTGDVHGCRDKRYKVKGDKLLVRYGQIRGTRRKAQGLK